MHHVMCRRRSLRTPTSRSISHKSTILHEAPISVQRASSGNTLVTTRPTRPARSSRQQHRRQLEWMYNITVRYCTCYCYKNALMSDTAHATTPKSITVRYCYKAMLLLQKHLHARLTLLLLHSVRPKPRFAPGTRRKDFPDWWHVDTHRERTSYFHKKVPRAPRQNRSILSSLLLIHTQG
jgi:hypothetical protein